MFNSLLNEVSKIGMRKSNCLSLSLSLYLPTQTAQNDLFNDFIIIFHEKLYIIRVSIMLNISCKVLLNSQLVLSSAFAITLNKYQTTQTLQLPNVTRHSTSFLQSNSMSIKYLFLTNKLPSNEFTMTTKTDIMTLTLNIKVIDASYRLSPSANNEQSHLY